MIKYTKTELRGQQVKLSQLQKYLPTLQLKKAMLQLEVDSVARAIKALDNQLAEQLGRLEHFAGLLPTHEAHPLFEAVELLEVKKHFENIAGVDIPVFEEAVFAPEDYALFDTPVWLEEGISAMKKLIEIRESAAILRTKKVLLEKELRDVSIRVNLFEKIMIPRTLENIKKIKIFLGDQFLAAVSQAKVAKRKIEERKLEKVR